jgi:CRP-like cAMP-binding protein
MYKDIKLLHEVKIFSTLKEEELFLLSNILNILKLKTDEALFKENDVGDCLYILISGRISITKSLTLKTSKSDFENLEKTFVKLSSDFKPFFGEIAMLDEKAHRTATITAIENCEILELKKSNFDELCINNPNIGYKVLLEISKVISKNLKKANDDVLKLTTALSIALS